MIKKHSRFQPLFVGESVGLSFTVGEETVTAVAPSNFTIPEGAITVIYGPSGSGKSSLLNVISGLQAPTSGTLLYKGDNVYDKTPDQLAHFRALELGIVYQTSYWVKSLSVLENVSLPQYFYGKNFHDAHNMAGLALERVDMKKYAPKSPLTLSGGEQQRIAVARAIINDCPVVIADEPTGSLDSKNGDKIINLLVELQRDSGKTIVLVTHNLEYLPIAHHLINIQDGQITEIDEKDIPNTLSTILQDTERRLHKLVRHGSDHA